MLRQRPQHRLFIWMALPLVLFAAWLCWPGPKAAAGGSPQGAPSTAAVHVSAIISATTPYILYARDDGTTWLKDSGGDAQLLVGQHPRLSADGRYLAYRAGEIHWGDLYVRDLLLGGPDVLALNNNDYVDGFAWTPGGRLVYDYACGIYIRDRDGANQQQLVGAWPASHYCENDAPHVNPVDGRLVWLNWTYGIAVAEPTGANPYWAPNTGPDDVYPIWSPDGEWFAFLRDYNNVFKIRPDGSDLTQLSYLSNEDSVLDSGGFAWTPNGRWLVVSAEVSEAIGLYAIATDGSGAMLSVGTAAGADPIYVDTVGALAFWRTTMPVMMRP